VRAAVVEAGFQGACGVVPGRNRPAADQFALHRVEVSGNLGLLGFAALLTLGGGLGLRRRR
jgi:hypothetical protein